MKKASALFSYQDIESGQTLIETMVAMALLAIGITGVMGLSSQSDKLLVKQRTDLNERRDFVLLSKQVAAPQTVRNSLEKNPSTQGSYPFNPVIPVPGEKYWNDNPPVPSGNHYLYRCMVKNKSCATASAANQEFVALGPFIDEAANTSDVTYLPISGSSLSDVLPYDSQGMPCRATSCPAAQYPFGVYTLVKTICEPKGPSFAELAAGPPYPSSILAPDLNCKFDSRDKQITVVISMYVVDRTSTSTPPPILYQNSTSVPMYTVLSGVWH